MLKVLHLISGGDTGGAKTHVLSLMKELQKNIQLKMICFMEGDFFQDAKAMGINIDVLNQKSRFDLTVVDEIVKLIKSEGFDIVHSHGARANFITGYIKKKVNIPCVTTIHSDYLHDFKGNIYKYLVFTTLNKLALNKFDYYIAVSDDFKKMLVDRNFPEKKIFTVYNGLDFSEKINHKERYEFLRDMGISALGSNILVGISARLHKVKGHEVFLEAASRILQNYEGVHFLLAGDGEERDELERLTAKLGIEKNVHFLGWLDDVYSFLNAIDINVLTSYTESFPYALLEGALMSKPTVASAVGGIPILIRDNETGCLFEAGSSSHLAEKLIYFLENEEKRMYFGNRLYEHARSNYSLEKLGKDHIDIYNEILGRKDI